MECGFEKALTVHAASANWTEPSSLVMSGSSPIRTEPILALLPIGGDSPGTRVLSMPLVVRIPPSGVFY